MKDFRCFDRDPAFVIRSTRPCRNGRRAKSQVGHKQKKEKEKKSNTTSEAIQKNPLQNSISSRTKKNLGKKKFVFFSHSDVFFSRARSQNTQFFFVKEGSSVHLFGREKEFQESLRGFFYVSTLLRVRSVHLSAFVSCFPIISGATDEQDESQLVGSISILSPSLYEQEILLG